MTRAVVIQSPVLIEKPCAAQVPAILQCAGRLRRLPIPDHLCSGGKHLAADGRQWGSL